MTDLPNLAVIGDVPVERTIGGPLVLYRLLAEYPPDRLRIIQGTLAPSTPETRLEGRAYTDLTYVPRRLLRNRYGQYTSAPIGLAALVGLRKRIIRALGGFRPDVVLTVSHGWLWLAAVDLADDLGARSVVICHDDWKSYHREMWFAGAVNRRFESAYRAASVRLCVCTAMAELYEKDYGVSADVLWPNRGSDSPVPKVRVRTHDGPLTAVYAGSLFGDSRAMVAALAAVLGRDGGRMHIYSPHPLGSLSDIPNVRHCGFASTPAEMAERAGESADLLFATMDFSPAARRIAATSFPSKLTDYTAIGLPILICGPEYSSAVRWAADWPGVAAVAAHPTADALAAAVRPLADPAARLTAASRAVEVGNRLFGQAAAEAAFRAAIIGRPGGEESP